MSSTGGSTKGGRGKPKSSKSISRSQKVGLQFLVGCIARFLKASKYAERVSVGALVYLSAVLEYLAVEDLEYDMHRTKRYKQTRKEGPPKAEKIVRLDLKWKTYRDCFYLE